MLGSSTHDTKRSEDVRARLAVLSELSAGWRMTLRRWHLLNKCEISRSDEYHYYQALIGVWPGEVSDVLAARLKAYMLKAAREAKEHTSWINPDTDYEASLERFVEQSLQNRDFIADVKATMTRVAPLGLLVGLSQALVKVASPGVPDYYQGTELWDFSLVDPDNRRPVDFGRRSKLLEQLAKRPPEVAELLANLPDGRAKLHVIRQGLAVRRAHPALFHGGEYRPLQADAGYEENVIAFSLGGRLVAIAPRLFSRKLPAGAAAPIGAFWGDARLTLPQAEFEDVVSGARHHGGARAVAELLANFPVALLIVRD
jgi:(1->4)-alpha-D-glucan 1-alpha-D-glucosylmutase